MATGTSSKSDHVHYIYGLRFNLPELKLTKMKKCTDKLSGRVYRGSSHCIYIEKFDGIRKRHQKKEMKREL